MSHAGTLVFSHGNGFPACCYRQLFQAWQDAGWRVLALPMYGHDPRYPVTSNWPHLREQGLDFIDTHLGAAPGRVVLVGHSMGGYLSLKMASARRGLAQAVVLLDSPVVGGWRRHAVAMAKRLRLSQRLGPGRISARRRHHWPSTEDALAHFRAKHSFARWAPGVLEDYLLGGGLVHRPDGVHLAFDRAVETRIYNTLPHQLPGLLHRHPVGAPVHFLGGQQSSEVRQAGLDTTRHLVQATGGQMVWMPGSHLFPMEQPQATAQQVLACLSMSPQQTPVHQSA